MRDYDHIAAWYTSTRNPTIGLADVAAFAETLPTGGRVLDLGCGDGVPISRFLAEAGFGVQALDSSAEMVRRFRVNLPGVPVRCGRAEAAHFDAASFDAVVAWGVLFHLAAPAQEALIARVATWLRPGGRFLFTSGDADGVREGVMDGVSFRYVSLGPDGYARALAGAGMSLVEDYVGEGQNPTYVAAKPRCPPAPARAV